MNGYLCFNEKDLGSLYVHWSAEVIDYALGVLEPEAALPAHKTTTNHGKETLIKPANQGVHKQAYWEGFVLFIKLAQQVGAIVTIYPEAPIKAWAWKDPEVVLLEGAVNHNC